MANSPQWKVYDPAGNYVAACKDLEAAAALMGLYGAGATIRDGHGPVLWKEGGETIPASESYDTVSQVVRARCREKNLARLAKQRGITVAQLEADLAARRAAAQVGARKALAAMLMLPRTDQAGWENCAGAAIDEE